MNFDTADANYMELFEHTKDFLRWFVGAAPAIYGSTFVVYNVHNLIHLHADVENNQCGLERLSAFPFENFLHRIKNMVRKSHQPLSQIAKRVEEIQQSNFNMTSKTIKTKIQSSAKNNRNSWFYLKTNKIVEVLEVADCQIQVKMFSFDKSNSYFQQPFDSKLMMICFLPRNSTFKIESVSPKFFLCLPLS